MKRSALALLGDFLIDGEAVGDVLHVFDVLEREGIDLRHLPYRQRLVELLNLLATGSAESFLWVPCYWDVREKSELLQILRLENKEGIVFKRASAPYTAGRPASGGDQYKFKFVETASVIVSAVNARRSVAIALMNGTISVAAGNVTIPPDHPIPVIGQVVEVRYLYAFPESGVLYQPVYLGMREDIDPAECLVEQLKYKPAA